MTLYTPKSIFFREDQTFLFYRQNKATRSLRSDPARQKKEIEMKPEITRYQIVTGETTVFVEEKDIDRYMGSRSPNKRKFQYWS